MKRAALLKFFIVGVALSMTAVGCHRGPKGLTPIPGIDNGGPKNPGITGIDNGLGNSDQGVGSNNLKTNPEGIEEAPRMENADFNKDFFQAQTVHFDFDSSVVKPDDINNVQYVADYLKAHPGHAVLIEGHCDERGTEEYNRALGERRALSVREAMVRMGGDAGRVYTKSYGKDDPVDPAHNAAAWAKNRRGVFVLMTPKKP